MRTPTLLFAACLAGFATNAPAAPPGAAAPAAPPAAPAADPNADGIAAVVNGDVITRADVDNRARLFALSAGQQIAPETLAKLRPQITRELIDDRLRAQEIQRRKIVVPDVDVAHAIADIEQRNGLPAGGLHAKLTGQGVTFSTLIGQIRGQLGWTRVLRQELAERGRIGEAEISEQERLLKAQQGQPQYRVGEIFVAAEFSQSQTALQGGDVGWVRPDQLDPQVASLVAQMPQGAVSNPVRVAGGFEVVTLREKRTVGSDMATVLDLRQTFFPFTTPLNPQAPTDQQKKALQDGESFSKTASSCPAMEAENKTQGEKRPSNPGEVRLDHLAPQMQQLLGALQPGQASKALVTPDGIMVVMVCSRAQKNLAAMTRDDIANQLLEERVELASRQLQQDIRRRALIDQRSS